MMMIMLNCYHRLKYDWRDLKGFKGIVPIFLLYSAKNSYSASLNEKKTETTVIIILNSTFGFGCCCCRLNKNI